MTDRLRILIVEDVADDAKIVEHELREGGLEFEARRVESREDFVAALESFDPDVILVDYKLPHFDGLSAIRIARERRPDTPAIIVTGTLGDERAVELLREGARDYVLKDRLSRLVPAVQRALDDARRAAESRRFAAQLQVSEMRYRRLFETAQDGILILDAETGVIEDVNPYLLELLGCSRQELAGRRLWEVGMFQSDVASQAAFDDLRAKGYKRFEDLPLASRDGGTHEVEFVSNVYEAGRRKVIQCNIRDISERAAARRALEAQLDELRRFEKVAIDRELRLDELKTELGRLRAQRKSSEGRG